MRRASHRGGSARIAAAVLLLLNSLLLSAQTADLPHGSGGRKIGIVVVEGGIPGKPISASFVADCETLRSVRGVNVVPVTIDNTVSLEDLVVDTGDGRLQEATEPVLASIPVDGRALTFRVLHKGQPKEPLATPVISMDVTPQPETSSAEYMAPPVADHGVLQVLGPVGGDTTHLHATEDGRPIRILTSRPGAMFLEMLGTTPGMHKVELDDENGVELFKLTTYAVGTTVIHSDGILHPGQTAQSSFVLNGPERFAADVWGFVEFHVLNERPEIAVVEGQQDFVFSRQDFLEGPKRVTVTLRAVREGVSRLRGQLRLNLHPVSAAANPQRTESEQDFTAMDQTVRGYLRSLGKDPSNWTVTRIPNGGLRYTSPDGGTVLDTTGDKAQVVMEFVR